VKLRQLKQYFLIKAGIANFF